MIPRMFCMTSDGYIDAVKPFLWLFRKYWKDGSNKLKVVVVGFSEPEFDLNAIGDSTNVEASFLSLGNQSDYPVDKWSDGLIKLLDTVDDELIILMLEDYWPIREVNVGAIRLAADYMKRYPKTLKFDLVADRFFAFNAKRDYRFHGWLDIVLSDPDSPYQMSLMPGIWRKDLLKEVTKPGWSPWTMELDGTNHMKNFKHLDVVGSGQWPIKNTLAFRNGDAGKLLLQNVNQEDVYAMKQLGLLAKWLK